jgi:hypothetical protein
VGMSSAVGRRISQVVWIESIGKVRESLAFLCGGSDGEVEFDIDELVELKGAKLLWLVVGHVVVQISRLGIYLESLGNARRTHNSLPLKLLTSAHSSFSGRSHISSCG